MFENNLKTLGGLCDAASAVIDSSVAWAGQPESNYATVWLVWCSQCNVDSSVAWAVNQSRITQQYGLYGAASAVIDSSVVWTVQPEPNYTTVWLVWYSQGQN